MTAAYRIILLLYPRRHRDRFAEEMIQVFEEACAGNRAQGWACYARFVLAEFRGLLGGAARAWLERGPHSEIPAASAATKEVVEAQAQVDAAIAAMVYAIANHQFEKARVLSDQERQARENLHAVRQKYGLF
jgi:hypothetical protein